MSPSVAPLYPAKTIARLFNLTERRVQQLAKEGIIPKAERGKYELIGSVQGYVKYLQDRSVGQHEMSPNDLMEQKVRLTRAQADEKEISVRLLQRELVHASEVVDTWSKIVGVTKGRLMGIPMRVAPAIVAATDLRAIENAVREGIVSALDDLADAEIE